MNIPVNITYQFSDLNITSVRIEKMMGYDPGTAPEPIPGLILSVLNSAGELTEIKGVYLIPSDFIVNSNTASIKVNSHYFNTGKIVTRKIYNAEQIVFFILTAGKGIELQSQKYLSGNDPLLGYIFDVLGSLTVEASIDKTKNYLEDYFLQYGLKITNPYSPGYCGWPVSDQQKLFALFNNETCGVTLSATCLMNPIKSVSGIIGIGRNVKKQPYACQLCDAKNCIYRDKKD